MTLAEFLCGKRKESKVKMDTGEVVIGEGLGDVTGQEWEDGLGIRTVVLAFWREVIAVTKILGRT